MKRRLFGIRLRHSGFPEYSGGCPAPDPLPPESCYIHELDSESDIGSTGRGDSLICSDFPALLTVYGAPGLFDKRQLPFPASRHIVKDPFVFVRPPHSSTALASTIRCVYPNDSQFEQGIGTMIPHNPAISADTRYNQTRLRRRSVVAVLSACSHLENAKPKGDQRGTSSRDRARRIPKLAHYFLHPHLHGRRNMWYRRRTDQLLGRLPDFLGMAKPRFTQILSPARLQA